MGRLVGRAVVVVLLLLLAVPAGASVQEIDPEVYGLEVEVGLDGQVVPGAWTPVEVTLAPRRPVAATLAVESRGPGGSLVRREQEIEVAGAARNAYRFVVPEGPLRVVITEGGGSATLEQRVDARSSRFLVGRLGGVPQPAPPLRSAPTSREGVWVGVDPAWVSESMALSSLSALVADGSDIAALGQDARQALAGAVAAGLQLVVVADADGPVPTPGLPDAPEVTASSTGGARTLQVAGAAWRLERDGGVAAAAAGHGHGRVVHSAVAPDGGDGALWSRLVGPGAGRAPQEWDVSSNPYQFTRLMGGSDGSVPTVPWLAAFLAVYILVVGPVNALVLRRLRRQELAWATVPVVTAVFTAAAFTGAVGGRPDIGSTARVVWSIDGTGQEVRAVALRNPRAGARTAMLPGQGWAVDVISPTGAGTGRAQGVLTPTTGGVQARVELAALELGGVLARRPTAERPPLELTAVAGPDGVGATVTNTGDRPLDDVVVRAATTDRRVGTLAPGQQEQVELGGSRLRLVPPYRDVLEGIVGARGGAAPPATLEAVLRADVLDGDPGLVWAVATSTAAAADVLVDGEPTRDDGTRWAVGTEPTLPDDGTVGPYAVGRELVSDAGDFRPGPQAVEGTDAAVLRYRLPAGGSLAVLHQDLERGADTAPGAVDLEAWDVPEQRWVALADAFPDGGGDPARLVSPLGQVHVRATGELFPFEFSGRTVSGIDTEEASS